MFFHSEIIEPAVIPGTYDAYFANVSLLLKGDAANNSTNNTFVDSGPSNLAITRFGATTQGSFSPFSRQSGAWATYHPVRTSFFSNSFFVNGTTSTGNIGENFTAEFWFNGTSTVQATNATRVLAKTRLNTNSSDSWHVGVDADGRVILTVYYGSTSTRSIKTFSSVSRVDDNKWHHCAIVKQGTAYKIFINGALDYSETWTTALSQGTAYNVTVGGTTNNPTGGDYGRTNCYLSNVRITNTAVYTDAFAPSASPLTAIPGTVLLVCQDNRLKDNGPNNYSCTVQQGTPTVSAYGPFADTNLVTTSELGSGYFNGTTDYLTLADNNDWTFTGDFTIDAWIYPEVITTGIQTIVAHWPGAIATNCSFSMAISNGKLWSAYGIGSSNIGVTGAATLVPNTWTHVAVSRSGTTLRLFVNGILDATATVSGAYNNSNGVLSIGRTNANDGRYLQGHISNLRIVNGTSLYTGNFSVPTSPATAVANTKLLSNFANAGAVDSSKNLTLTTVGNAKISTDQGKYGGSSVYFDGNGDYLAVAANNAFEFGTGDFTIESWVYLIADSTTYQMVASIAWGAGKGLQIRYGDAGFGRKLQVNVQGHTATSVWSTAATTATYRNAWVHLAFTRSSGVCRLFVNGVVQNVNNGANPGTYPFTSFTDTSNVTGNTGLGVGAERGGTATLFGYIDDFRITKGVARYTENFTPPDSLPTTGV